MNKLWTLLAGKKTYIISIAAFIYGTGITAGWWAHNAALDIVFASLGAAALRSGMGDKIDPVVNPDAGNVLAGGGVGAGNTDVTKTLP